EGQLSWTIQGKDRDANSSLRFTNGRCVLLYTGGPLDVIVGAAGYQTVALKGVASNQRVVLRAGIEVHLSLAPGLRVPEPPYFLGAVLMPEDDSLASWNFSQGVDFAASGELVTFAPASGKVRVQLTLTYQRPQMWTTTHLSGEPQVLDIADLPGPQSFEIRFDPEVLEQTRENFGENF